MSKSRRHFPIPVYIINCKNRQDRLRHILAQFNGKSEFNIHIVEAIEHRNGTYGLWLSLQKCIIEAVKNRLDYIIICEDDHLFTPSYDKDILIYNIVKAKEQRCDILSGGIGGFNYALLLDRNRFWVDLFSCTQFLVIYKKFFKPVLDTQLVDNELTDIKLSTMTENTMVLFPFISKQKEFGYSDISKDKHVDGLIYRYMNHAEERLRLYKEAYSRYFNI